MEQSNRFHMVDIANGIYITALEGLIDLNIKAGASPKFIVNQILQKLKIVEMYYD